MRASAGPVLVTGGSGFIAATLIQALAPRWNVRASQRGEVRFPHEFRVGPMGEGADWRHALDGVSTVVHLAGPSNSYFPDDVLHRAIVRGAEELVEQASAAGVRRFVFVSSMKACAGRSEGRALREDDPPQPEDAYGRAKLEAERIVLSCQTLSPIVLRPPLVYAANAKGNLGKFLRRLDSAAPLPFGGVNNRRSMIALGSLVDAIVKVLDHETSPTGVFHIADSPAVSTAEMSALIRQGMGRPARVFQLPGFERFGPPPLVRSFEVDARRFRESFAHEGVDTRAGLLVCGQEWRAMH